MVVKQAIGICATHKNTAIQDILDDRCPNCGKRREDNLHLNRCIDPGRIQLFCDGVRKLGKWMKHHCQIKTELAFWVTRYLLHGGKVHMLNLGMLRPMSAVFREAAESQDMIRWSEFLHGKVSTKFHQIQDSYCILVGTTISGAGWMAQFARQ